MIFNVGDKIIYPVHGACVVEAVEEKEILGERKLCYILNIPQEKLHVMVPMDKAVDVGMRQIVNHEILENVLSDFNLGNTDPIILENQRWCKDINKKKFKSGDIYKGAEIIRDLTRKGQINKLGADDVNMLNNARHVFVSEIMEVKGLKEEQAVRLLDEVLNS
ncbi:RNA polymerase-binding transcription factor CarD [Desulfosporosinus acididurans]|uniref:RNA polymerase-binding transcription factor CarD n=1 Tax=Desulfosporosinus acididurans TaxID=476652 RepID=A0A0J1FLA7_9FIRM|nr:RNA polymerase-binding transcription factor CarD [Desulfosporosinus acididurans]